jgi:NitT/TauT family transport system ATP-binding protein
MVSLEMRDVCFSYNEIKILDGVSLRVSESEFLCILGPSGCGKTTLLRLCAGLLQPDSGTIAFNGRKVIEPSGTIGMIFQQSTLFPWLTVEQNVDFALRSKTSDLQYRRRECQRLLAQVELSPFATFFPKELSGGMKQRACLARAFALEPRILLLDEPFSALDAISRTHMRRILIQVWDQSKTTMLFVTHDVDEAIELSDRVALMSQRPSQIAAAYNNALPRPRVSEGIHEPGFEQARNELAIMAKYIYMSHRE